MILALETTGDVCSVAIRDERGVIAERAFRHRMRLSERLIDDVDTVLRDAEVTRDDVEGFGVGIGPGSFTGVRIGVTTVKTWAHVMRKPVVGVNSLDTLAVEYSACANALIAPIIRARPGSVYTAFFSADGSGDNTVSPIELIEVEELVQRLSAMPAQPIIVCGEALDRYREAFTSSAQHIALGRAQAPRASLVAEIAENRISAGQADDALSLVPLYISPPLIGPAAKRK